MNQFEKYYNELQDLEDILSKQDLDEYTKQNAENQKDAILHEIASDNNFYVLFYAYMESEELDNSCIDLDNIRAIEVENYYNILVQNDIKEFTVSSRTSEFMDIVSNFVDCGCKILGVVQVNKSMRRTTPALKFSV